MIMQGMIANSKLDRQNMRLSKTSLLNCVDEINGGHSVQAISINHDPTIMPIGKVLSAEARMDDDGEVEIYTAQEVAEAFREVIYGEEKFYTPVLDSEDKRPIIRMAAPETGIALSVDYANYSQENYLELKKEIHEMYSCELEGLGRKALYNDPIFVIALSTMSPLIVMTGKKTCEKLSDKVSDDLVLIYSKIKGVLGAATNAVKKGYTKQTFKIVEAVNGCIIELLYVAKDVDQMLAAIEESKLAAVSEKIEALTKLFDADCIQFLFNDGIQKWEFNYLLSKTGDIIGSEKCYKNTKDIYDKNVLGKSKINVSLEFSSGKLGVENET